MFIHVGDRVTFTMMTKKGNTVSMTSKTGTVIAINENQIATVRTSKRITYRIATIRLRKASEKTEAGKL